MNKENQCWICERDQVSVRCARCHFLNFCSKDSACALTAWGIHRKVCHPNLKADKVFKQPILDEKETNFLRNYWSLDQIEKYSDSWYHWTEVLQLEHDEILDEMAAADFQTNQNNLILFRAYIHDVAMEAGNDNTNDQRMEAWKLNWKKSNFPFYCLSVVQRDMVMELDLDQTKMFPLLSEIFRRYTLRRIQLDEMTRNSSGEIVGEGTTVATEVLQASFRRCAQELYKIEETLPYLERKVVRRVFDAMVLNVACNCGRLGC